MKKVSVLGLGKRNKNIYFNNATAIANVNTKVDENVTIN